MSRAILLDMLGVLWPVLFIARWYLNLRYFRSQGPSRPERLPPLFDALKAMFYWPIPLRTWNQSEGKRRAAENANLALIAFVIVLAAWVFLLLS